MNEGEGGEEKRREARMEERRGRRKRDGRKGKAGRKREGMKMRDKSE